MEPDSRTPPRAARLFAESPLPRGTEAVARSRLPAPFCTQAARLFLPIRSTPHIYDRSFAVRHRTPSGAGERRDLHSRASLFSWLEISGCTVRYQPTAPDTRTPAGSGKAPLPRTEAPFSCPPCSRATPPSGRLPAFP
jgi:hypothetical protein